MNFLTRIEHHILMHNDNIHSAILTFDDLKKCIFSNSVATIDNQSILYLL